MLKELTRKRRNILLVEDQVLIAASEMIELKKHGYDVVHVLNGEKAIETVKEKNEQFDLILMDIDLGKGIDGTQAAQEILREFDIPVVFLSSHTEKDIVEKTEKITYYGYVVKDSGIVVLDASIKMAFKLFEAQRDINKQKLDIENRNREVLKAQEELQQSEQRFRGAFETAAHGMALVDINGRFLQINQAFCNIIGYTKEEILTIDFQKITYPDDLELDMQNVKNLLDGKEKTYRMEKRYFHKDGHIIWVILSVSLVRDKNDNPLYFVSQVIDITERKMAEDVIKKQQEFSTGILAAMRDGFSLVNPQGEQIDVNEAFCQMTGFSREELIGVVAPNYPYWPPEEFDNINQAFERSIQLDFENFELIFMRKNGERFPVIVSPAPLIDSEGNIISFVATVKDITERKLAEQEKQKLLQEKELLLKEVHHRTRNNMNIMMSLLSLQASKLNDEIAIEALKDAGKRMKSMTVLYDKLYNTSNFKELPANEFLSSLIDEIVNIFPNGEMIKISKDLDNFLLDSGTLLSLGIIINELITNAMKYAFEDRENNEISVTAKINIDEHVVITFQDNGVGLDEFIDVDTSKGLGLMLVSALTKQINGKISIERNDGTKFILEFDIE